MLSGFVDSLSSVILGNRKPVYIGRGRRTLYTIYKMLNRSKYVPHQSAREITRRRRQIAAGQLEPVFNGGVVGSRRLVCGSRWLQERAA